MWVGISIVLQMAIGLFLGHIYDTRISMATGYLVATGQNPYVPQNLTSIFNNASFQNMTSIGYPPPWPILLGLIYLVSFKIIPNLFVYNLAIKIPIIAANITLVFLVEKILRRLNSSPKSIRIAQIFLLFNPFLLLTTSAWGQIEPIVVLLVISSYLLLDAKKYILSAFLLGIAISFKPVALPLLPVVFLYLTHDSLSVFLRFLITNILTILGLCVTPFLIFGWDPTIIFQHWNAQFSMNGGLSWVTALLPLNLAGISLSFGWVIGFLWMPALGIATWFLRNRVLDFVSLLRISVGMVLLFFVTRTWLSEPNLNLILPLIVILVATGEISRVQLSISWILPLVFSLFNTALVQLLFLAAPTLMDNFLKLSGDFYVVRFLIVSILSIGWIVFASFLIRTCFRTRRPNIPISQTSLGPPI
jgi:Gpi18-like mannosyltransferase